MNEGKSTYHRFFCTSHVRDRIFSRLRHFLPAWELIQFAFVCTRCRHKSQRRDSKTCLDNSARSFKSQRKQILAQSSLPHSPPTSLISPSLGIIREAAPLICTYTHTHTKAFPLHPLSFYINLKSYYLQQFKKSTNHLSVLVEPAPCRPCKQQCKKYTRTSRNWTRILINWRNSARSEVHIT